VNIAVVADKKSTVAKPESEPLAGNLWLIFPARQ